MPGAIGWAAQVLSPGGGLRWRSRSSARDLLVRISLPVVSGSQADDAGALVMVARLLAVLGGFRA